MSDVFVVVQTGVYRHAISGAFTDLDAAVAAGKALLMGEPDRYHYYDIVRLALDPPAHVEEATVCSVMWRTQPDWPVWRGSSLPPGGMGDIEVKLAGPR